LPRDSYNSAKGWFYQTVALWHDIGHQDNQKELLDMDELGRANIKVDDRTKILKTNYE